MGPIELLVEEHRTILGVLDRLEAWAKGLAGASDPADLAAFVAFLRDFADARHHGKEEALLFRAMVDHGFPARSGPIAVMLAEHDDGRAHVRAMADLAARCADWTDDDRAAAGRHARAFAALLRSHIAKEDDILYPMALRHLPPAALEALADAFTAFEAARPGSPAAAP